jgi:hypothetical protein
VFGPCGDVVPGTQVFCRAELSDRRETTRHHLVDHGQ